MQAASAAFAAGACSTGFVRGIDHAVALHCAEMKRSAIVDYFRGAYGAGDDVVHVSPIADLFAIAPHDKRIVPDERSGNHGDDGVIFMSTRSVDREIAAG